MTKVANVTTKEAEAKPEIKRLHKQTDDVTGDCFYYDQKSPPTLFRTGLMPYIYRSKNDLPSLRLRIVYRADDWLFVDQVTIKAKAYINELPARKWKRDNGNGEIWEWSDEEVTIVELDALKELVAAGSGKMRFNGKLYYNDKPIGARDIAAIKNVLTAYEAWGFKL